MMIRRFLASCAVLTAAFCSAPLCVAEAGDEADEAAKIAALGPGVNPETVIKDKNGRITSLLVVGQARISTVLGKAKGMEVAREKASLDADVRFVEFLNKAPIKFSRTAESETIEISEGTEGAGEDAQKATSKSSDRLVTKQESVVQGFVRSMQKVAEVVNGEEKTLIIIKAWDSETDKSAKRLASDLASDDVKTKEKNKPSKKAEPAGKTADEKKIEDKTVTSGALKKFLPKSK